jgi:hypothetical protein
MESRTVGSETQRGNDATENVSVHPYIRPGKCPPHLRLRSPCEQRREQTPQCIQCEENAPIPQLGVVIHGFTLSVYIAESRLQSAYNVKLVPQPPKKG